MLQQAYLLREQSFFIFFPILNLKQSDCLNFSLQRLGGFSLFYSFGRPWGRPHYGNQWENGIELSPLKAMHQDCYVISQPLYNPVLLFSICKVVKDKKQQLFKVKNHAHIMPLR